MIFFCLPKGSTAALEALRVRLSKNYAATLNANGKEATDGASSGTVEISIGAHRISVTERCKRGTGGENARMLERENGKKMKASDWPRRWEVHDRDDPEDAYGNDWANVLDAVKDVAPDAVAVTP